MPTIKRAVTRQQLKNSSLVRSPVKIKLKEIYPKYFEILKIFRLIQTSNENIRTRNPNNPSPYTVTPCSKCCFCSQCSNNADKIAQNKTGCQFQSSGLTQNELSSRLHLEQVTLHGIASGLQPFGIISQIINFDRESFEYRHDEYRTRDRYTYLTFTANPFFHLTSYRYIINQINNNIYENQEIINSIDYHMYFYIYKKLILNELAELGILDKTQLGITNCTGCEIANINSCVCDACSLRKNQELGTYYNGNQISYPTQGFWSLKDLTPIKFGANFRYVTMKPIAGFETEANSTNVKVHQVIHYGLYLEERPQLHAFKLLGANREVYLRW